MGQVLIYRTKEEPEKRITHYFESCWQEKWVENKKTGEWQPLFDRHGNPLMEQVKPYTMAGLALHLGVSRMTVVNYSRKEDYAEVIEKARNVCEAFLEEGMLKGTVPAIPGIFNAKNNYGWKDKSELGVSTQIVEMPSITRGGQALEFDVGTAIDSQLT